MRAAVVGMVLLCGIAQGAEPKTVTNSIGMVLIEIPAGKFTMGSPVDEKDHLSVEEQVAATLTKPFWLGKTEVTQGQWQEVMGTAPWGGKLFALHVKEHAANWVNFFDAMEFCDKLTEVERKAGKLKANEEYRLPTEAEWEYACRAGTKTAFSFGDESKLNSYAWWGGLDYESQIAGNMLEAFEKATGNARKAPYPHEVGLKKPNPWGLYDMHGNAGEWCSDWYNDKFSGGADPVGPEEGVFRVIRGGSFAFRPGLCRSASRVGIPPSNSSNLGGFRVARSQSAQ